MAIQNRTVTIKNIFAENANTTIPNPPVSDVSYRNTTVTAAEIGEGWPYKKIVDSAKFNEAMYEYTTICKQLEKYGFLPWCADTDYPAGGCALGTDGNVYQAKVATGPSSTAVDPVNDTSHTYWGLFYYSSFTESRAIASDANGKLTASSTTSTELGYVHGVTSAIQTQLNAKATPANITSAINTLLSSLYPVGSLYITTNNASTCPLASLMSGSTWALVAADKALWTSNRNANTTISPGLPNITGRIGGLSYDNQDAKDGMSGAFYWGSVTKNGAGSGTDDKYGYFDASRSNSIYGNSSTVQPPAYRVNVWRRTA